jgi:hypothetical protein
LAKGFAEADLLCPAEVLNKLSVGERLGDGDVIFDGVSFPFKPAFDDDGDDKKGNVVLVSPLGPTSSPFFFTGTFFAFFFIISAFSATR